MKSQELIAERDDIRSKVLHTGKSQGLAENGQREGKVCLAGKIRAGKWSGSSASAAGKTFLTFGS